MQAFCFDVEHDRYIAPPMLIVEAASSSEARALALDHRRQSPHHLCIAVYADDQRLLGLSAGDADRRGRR